jgi:hypothetical protein
VLQTPAQFAGAIKVKLPHGILEGHMEQAKKEAFAMWCHNATQQSYEPVWVVLTDLDQVRELLRLIRIILDKLGQAFIVFVAGVFPCTWQCWCGHKAAAICSCM